jgi:hypothetical protein
MCCFSPLAPRGLLDRFFPPTLTVAGTRIFARHEGPETQLLAYAMRLTTPSPVAMILPLPTRPGDGEDALAFIDLSARPQFFEDLEKLFQPPPRKGGLLGIAPQSRTLAVHKVGAFEASFVPSVDDFHRLDPRFRLPTATWNDVPDARHGGFAVFQLDAGSDLAVHPMAFRFRSRRPSELFFPTVHVHDGRVHSTAIFDHTLYLQTGTEQPGFETSFGLTADDACGLLVPGATVARRSIRGTHPNRDTWVEA